MLNNELIRKDFPMLQNNPELIYLDSGATSLKPQCVIDSLNQFYTHITSNVHRGDYPISAKVSSMYDNVRNKVANFIHAESHKEIVFTSGATQGLNWIAYGYGKKILTQNDVILTTYLEHASNILPWFIVAKETKSRIVYIPCDSLGRIDMEAYGQLLATLPVKVVVIAGMSNVLGYIQPLQQLSEMAHRNGSVFVVDGAQSVPHVPTNVKVDDIDFLAFSAHKMCGSSGVGVLYGKKALLDSIDPLLLGGGSNARFNDDGQIILKETPEKFEAGTPNIEGVLALGSAVDYLMQIGMNNIEHYETELKNYAMEQLNQLDNVVVYNGESHSGLISFNVNGIFAQDAAAYLASKNIAVRTGNHCAKLIDHVMGVNESIRASMYFYTSKQDIDALVSALKDITLEKCIDAAFTL